MKPISCRSSQCSVSGSGQMELMGIADLQHLSASENTKLSVQLPRTRPQLPPLSSGRRRRRCSSVTPRSTAARQRRSTSVFSQCRTADSTQTADDFLRHRPANRKKSATVAPAPLRRSSRRLRLRAVARPARRRKAGAWLMAARPGRTDDRSSHSEQLSPQTAPAESGPRRSGTRAITAAGAASGRYGVQPADRQPQLI